MDIVLTGLLERCKMEKLSKFIALILRHKPEAAGVILDSNGWADTENLIQGIRRTKDPSFTLEKLAEIVYTDEKGRYSFSHDLRRIRANQGHSVKVDVELQEVEPPTLLYHGTATKYIDSIEKEGIVSKSRLYVHLSETVNTATEVGKRHGKPVVYTVHAKKMFDHGYKFYKSVNGVWLTDKVPTDYFGYKIFDWTGVEETADEVYNEN